MGLGRIHFTICSNNYLHFARNLAASLKRADPEANFTVFLADKVSPETEQLSSELEIVPVDRLGIENLLDMALKYNLMEFNTAIKPFCFEYVFRVLGYDAAIYLDPDIYVLKPLEHVHDALQAGFSCVVTPHISEPISDDGKKPVDQTFLLSGIYNLGFIALNNNAETRHFLDWWSKKLSDDCFSAQARGVFVDQKYVDFAPAFFEKIKILRHPGYNVAYWNLTHRLVTEEQGRYRVNADYDLHFLHFSGASLENDNVFSKHQNRYARSDLSRTMRKLYEHYISEVAKYDRCGRARLSQIGYAFGGLNNGIVADQFVRGVYAQFRSEVSKSQNPFELGPEFFNAQSSEVLRFSGLKITRLYFEVWKRRGDFQAAFDLRTPRGQWEYLHWCATGLEEDHNISRLLIQETPKTADPPAMTEFSSHVPALLNKALTSRSFMIRNFIRRLLKGKKRALDYWSRKLHSSDPGMLSLLDRWPAMPPRGSDVLPHGLQIHGIFQAETGTSEAARGFVRSIATTGLPFSIHRVSLDDRLDDHEKDFSPEVKSGRFDTALLCLNADLTTQLENLVPSAELHGRRKIGHWVWELPVFPAAWAGALSKVDEIWVPSRFVAMGLKAATGKIVRVVPYAVNRSLQSSTSVRSAFGLPEDVPLILVAFDFNSFVARKNPEAAIKAFFEAFPAASESSPHLVLKFHGKRNGGTDLIRKAMDDRRVHVIDKALSDSQMNQLQNACDIFLSTHRSEGFGLNIAECMLLEKIVIATGFSGNEDFMTSANSILIPYDLRKVGRDEYPYWTGQFWADPVHDAVVEALRASVNGMEALSAMRKRARLDIMQNYSNETIGNTVIQALGGSSTIGFG
jgi:glycosyltransferase involved in cell wall biosynthesis